jgi:hypothetical protein
MHKLFGRKQNATHGKGWGKGYGPRALFERDKDFQRFDFRNLLRRKK